MRRALVYSIAILAATFVLTAVGFAQDPPQPPAQTMPQPSGRLQFSAAVETVTLDVVVVDRKGRFVPGLERSEFVILDGGVPQKITLFSDEFTPVTTMLLLDSSSSVRSSLSAIQTAAYLFAQNLSEGDTARIGLFANDVRYGTNFTRSLEEHYAFLMSMRPAGRTALYDAIVGGLSEVSIIDGRKSLLLFTDGDDAGPADQGSQSSQDEALEAAKLSEVTIYTVGFTGWGPSGSDSVNRPFLTSLAEATGGRAFFPEDVDQVKQAFADVQDDLHRHYRMAYAPVRSTDPTESWRPLEVQIQDRPELVVRTRQGYYATASESP